MIKYTAEDINKEYNEICERIDTRHNDKGSLPHAIAESECFSFAAVQDVYARITNDMEDVDFYREPCVVNVLEVLAEWINQADTYELSYEMYNECLIANKKIIKEVERNGT